MCSEFRSTPLKGESKAYTQIRFNSLHTGTEFSKTRNTTYFLRGKSTFETTMCACLLSNYHFFWAQQPPVGQGLLIHEVNRSHTTTHQSVGILRNEWWARSRDFTTHNTHNRQTSMPPVRFEPTVSAGQRPQNYTLHRAATGIGSVITVTVQKSELHTV
jgi:hypothetical protein